MTGDISTAYEKWIKYQLCLPLKIGVVMEKGYYNIRSRDETIHARKDLADWD